MRPNSFTKQVTPVFAARTIGRRVSTQRKIAFVKCCCDPTEYKNHPSFVRFTNKFAPRITNCRVKSPIVSSKQISGAICASAFERRNSVYRLPAAKSPGTHWFATAANSGKECRNGTYSPNGTRCTFQYTCISCVAPEIRTAALKSLPFSISSVPRRRSVFEDAENSVTKSL